MHAKRKMQLIVVDANRLYSIATRYIYNKKKLYTSCLKWKLGLNSAVGVVVIDFILSLVGRFVLLIQHPLMVCNWPWFGRTVTGLYCNSELAPSICTEGAFVLLSKVCAYTPLSFLYPIFPYPKLS